ncbi:hypothetical protein [Tepidimicrobium xylanilyticum]|uniref:Uncharacterized protein n=1 Tax=Tepidimicrobium xylanilyticum TaxID=1123352 RepID=A0A1H2V2G2_9FIRM|nr:hypothetical protein [Tepidimicrobium xylanilyticum]GMG96750.1 hypothetical protein EN5CB1_15760 [Tepidimicrobium xylanilyticum]SDW62497.1 hypothetical protein SAMN05660923_00997 [Tepidimicrobium xylanilyticum]
MVLNLLIDLWKDSFICRILSIIKKVFINSLNNSFIISTLLKDGNIYGKNGLLLKTVERLHGGIIKLLKWIRGIFYKSISNSLLINLVNSVMGTIASDIYRFMFTAIGTSICTFGVLSFIKGVYSIKRTLFIIVLGILPFVFGWLNIEMDLVFKDSKFIRIIKKIFDYNS